MSYEAIDIVKNINNNIKEHLFDHIKKYINITFDKKSKIEEIKKINDNELKKEKYKELNKEFNDIYYDLIITRSILSCNLKYHSFFENEEIINFISENKDKFEDNLKNIYEKNSKNYNQFDDSMDYYEECEYYENLITNYNEITQNLKIRRESIEKHIKLSKEKLKDEIDNKEIIEFLGGVSPPHDDFV